MIWDGAFAPRIRKHRDHRHDSVYAHLKEHYGRPRIGNKVPVIASLITGELFDEEKEYYEVTIKMDSGREYVFLVESKTDGPPTEEEIAEQIEEQIKKKFPGGRHLRDFVPDWYVDQIDDEERRAHYDTVQSVSIREFDVDNL